VEEGDQGKKKKLAKFSRKKGVEVKKIKREKIKKEYKDG
jgi:hypothetical protein